MEILTTAYKSETLTIRVNRKELQKIDDFLDACNYCNTRAGLIDILLFRFIRDLLGGKYDGSTS